MLGLSKSQLKLLAEMFGNAAVAWFVSGIVSPIFVGYDTKLMIFSMITGMSLCFVFSFVALVLIRDIE